MKSGIQFTVILTGEYGAGKDTVADMIEATFPDQAKRYAFADGVRLALRKLNPVVGNNSGYPARWQAEYDRLGYPEFKSKYPEARRLMQYMGTEVGREMFGENVWTDIVLDSIQSDNVELAVITDARFENEVVTFLNAERRGSGNGRKTICVRVVREMARDPEVSAHSSEAGIGEACVDHTILNNYGLLELRGEVAVMLQNFGITARLRKYRLQ